MRKQSLIRFSRSRERLTHWALAQALLLQRTCRVRVANGAHAGGAVQTLLDLGLLAALLTLGSALRKARSRSWIDAAAALGSFLYLLYVLSVFAFHILPGAAQLLVRSGALLLRAARQFGGGEPLLAALYAGAVRARSAYAAVWTYASVAALRSARLAAAAAALRRGYAVATHYGLLGDFGLDAALAAFCRKCCRGVLELLRLYFGGGRAALTLANASLSWICEKQLDAAFVLRTRGSRGLVRDSATRFALTVGVLLALLFVGRSGGHAALLKAGALDGVRESLADAQSAAARAASAVSYERAIVLLNALVLTRHLGE